MRVYVLVLKQGLLVPSWESLPSAAGREKGRRGLYEVDSCSARTAAQSDALGVSGESVYCSLTHLCALHSRARSFCVYFWVGLLRFLPREQKSWPRCPLTLDPSCWHRQAGVLLSSP